MVTRSCLRGVLVMLRWCFSRSCLGLYKSFIGESLFSKFKKSKKSKTYIPKVKVEKKSNHKVSESQNKSICPDPTSVDFYVFYFLSTFCLTFSSG